MTRSERVALRRDIRRRRTTGRQHHLGMTPHHRERIDAMASITRYARVRSRSDLTNSTAYAVTRDDTFLGYVLQRDGEWDCQPARDVLEPVKPSYDFTFHHPNRQSATDALVENQET